MSYAQLMESVGQVNDLLNTQSILSWDARTMMPHGGHETRGKQLATLSVLTRDLLVSASTRSHLDRAEAEVAAMPDEAVEKVMVAQVRAAIDYHLAIPAELTRKRAELGANGHAVWAKARAESEFSQFAPILEQTVALNREMAEAIGYEAHPYDALMYRFEPGETVASLTPLFARLREALIPLVKAIGDKEQPRFDFLERFYPIDKQHEFALSMSQKVGYDLNRGRLDTTLHPFEVSFTRNDVRITTRFNPNYVAASLFGALHEAGHALYEQGVDAAYTRTPFATDLVGLYAVGGVSFGAHESQSRLWENHVGRSREFWAVNFAEAQAFYPEQLADVTAEEFFRAVNRCKPGLIRVEADELTYDFHVMLRTDIEAALIDGSLKVKDLPEAWNAKIKEYLGLDVPNDALGVLQDVHWSSGQIGTFCNYTIGNVMAGQLFETAKQDATIASGLASGNYEPLRAYMVENVHQHGRRYMRDELLVKATGRKLDPEPYIAHLTTKYSELYSL
ncbi:carboxypeptidase Taq [Devosia sp. YR412]|uniref:carboxypeptidase M32 n=1 Tax=Devosia sp. YR412 TaxID=1881030 RepID=UPI0008BFC520|nr:carboxypeptidase M32 [Devosia sp. YR412]SEQ40549.1 carboxypeptidase Taq [Devosia sp. YR412]